MNNLIKKYLIILVLFMPICSINNATADSIKPIPPRTEAYDKSYAEWATEWLKWALSIPKATNPMFDTTGAYAAIGQSGKVWFLAGVTNLNQGVAKRTIKIPNKTALFFPILNSFWINTPEYGDKPWSPSQKIFVRNYLKDRQDSVTTLILTVDGKTIPNLFNYRVPSTIGKCAIPPRKDENVFEADLINNPYICLSDGYWVMLPPLSVGKHNIHFEGAMHYVDPDPTNSFDFALNVTYNIIVEPKKSHHIELHK